MDHRVASEMIDFYLRSLRRKAVDTLVLGCTHFPFLRREIEAAAGAGVDIIDTGPAVAREVERRLGAASLLRSSPAAGMERFWTSGPPAGARAALASLWGTGELEPLPDQPAAGAAAG